MSKYFQSKKIDQGGRSKTFGRKQYLNLLRKQSEIQGIDRANFGRNMAYAQTGITRKFQAMNASAREKLGIPAAYGAPVMMPPTDRLTGALSIASSIASIAGAFAGSDIKLKENVVDANSQWDDIKKLKVRNFNFKASTGFDTHTQIGLIAQEAELVSPGLVKEVKDRVKTEEISEVDG